MYIPKVNVATDQEDIISFMKQFSFATIITSKNDLPIATHLPFLVDKEGNNIMLTAHFAKANEQWKDIEHHDVLVIFSEPHAYISPKNYEKDLNVPTWNYISVHAYGKATLITETEQVMEVLEASINYYEASYKQQWNNLPSDYKLKLLNGIVAFKINITDLQAKNKLSQNRSAVEKNNIINALSKSNDTNEKQIANFMKKEMEK